MEEIIRMAFEEAIKKNNDSIGSFDAGCIEHQDCFELPPYKWEQNTDFSDQYPNDIQYVHMHFLKKDSSFMNMFNQKNGGIWIPQSRIIQMIETHSSVMNQNGYGNLFPMRREDGECFVLNAVWQNHILLMRIRSFCDAKIWKQEHKHRLFTY